MVAFFPTIDERDWLERPRLAPFLPMDPDTGRPDDRNVQDFIAMLKELQSRNNEAFMACERDRFDALLAGTHGMRPPERLHMRWTNTWFRQGVELSRGAMQQFNLQQMATGQGQINPVARMVVARTNHLQAMAGMQPLPHKLYRVREVVRSFALPAFCINPGDLFSGVCIFSGVQGWLVPDLVVADAGASSCACFKVS
ncbi:hypothetical protein WJX84_010203 [Apatococcus fuscideae]|uniref:Uncharacterized protein n=1 Tax=Apatococcus fuscideae TaxID=2026836 RepID=A0AAW1SZV2_9CHLO